ncbi:hypothetical protein E2L07_05350 [Halalkalibacterium halodurans]|nr:hypothetical protein E2L07_19235 [Halalkalibacterium halodurans]TES47650.1 hypothetical protein E2L07_18590 [Halalkalibacterium halodurans]TES55132.1 hypothetical protein E2L07_07895 [Halalkalibacterium halodurans]TES56391.1 hypothetical protein E2L07_05350 [Halalkalibacterium halodurans]
MAFFVRSTERIPCPCCGGTLSVAGSRKRAWYKSSGERSRLVIRRLYCEACDKIHHELPDILVPYKRYDAESIEGTVSTPPRTEAAVDEATIFRWKNWFQVWVAYAIGCLRSIAIRFDLPVEELSESPQTVLHSLGQYVGMEEGWLKRAVRSMTNLNLWVTDPFRISGRTALE